MADKLGISKPGALKILNGMENVGLIASESMQTPRGKTRIFRVNEFSCIISVDPGKGLILFSENSAIDQENPLFGQVAQKEFRRDVSLYCTELISYMEDLAIILFGSVARGEATYKSDIDMVLVSKQKWSGKSKKIAMDSLYNASLKAKLQAKPLFTSLEEFLSNEDALSKKIKEEGMILNDAIGEKSLWASMKRYWNTIA
ncbi:MAG: nucleotidyltransferase domain-containing protein [Candidatus Thermoplasmatota archaeon]|nr:nucleotidyltransferase domain-containing protein [Candidatus Thermoplasmatota archaeon]